MKRYMLYSISAILLLILIVSGGTYAFLSARTIANNDNIFSSTEGFNIIYNRGRDIDSTINVVSSKEEGYNTTVGIRLAPNAVSTKVNLYINIEQITQNIAIEGFIWEVYGYKNGVQVYYNHGNFENYNDTNNNIVNIVQNYTLSEDETTFIVYFWLDGSKTDNQVLGGLFKGYIGARSEEFSAVLN